MTGPAMMSWLTLAYICLIGALTVRHMTRHPELIEPHDREFWDRMQASWAKWRGLTGTIIFVIAAVCSYFVSWLGNYMLLLLIPASIFLRLPSTSESDSK